jgi:hypothetical protein
MRRTICTMFVLAPAIGWALEPAAELMVQKKLQLMEVTKVNLVELTVPSRDYKSDGDPETLEVVFLDNKKEGPSRVSDDGEVIFFYKASDRKQQALIEQAFEIRARRALAKPDPEAGAAEPSNTSR